MKSGKVRTTAILLPPQRFEMDLTTCIGLTVGTILIVVAILIGGSLSDFVDAPALLITVGGTSCALLINFPFPTVANTFSVVKNCFLLRLSKPQDLIRELSELATTARRDGLLVLEQQLDQIKDPFLNRGLEMVIDGVPKDKLIEVLSIELNAIQERHATGKKLLDQLGALAPAFGMIGTLIGLIQMLRTLDDPSNIGVGMAIAMLTTFYGSLIANLFCIPMAGKLEMRSKEEMQNREMMITGLAALVEGEAPRAVESRLTAYLSPKLRAQRENG